MQNVRVYNDNIYNHKEKFKGDIIEIGAKKFIEMDFYDAVELLGQYTPIFTDGGGTPLPQSFKKLRIVKPEEFKIEDAKSFKCVACGELCESEDLLDIHVNEKHLEQLVDEDEQKKRRKKRDEV